MMMRRDQWWDDDPSFHVLVPGLMGVGFVISLLVLVSDVIVKMIPRSRRGRNAQLEQRAQGRVNDLAAVATGVPPRPGDVHRRLRSRTASVVLGLIAAAAALGIILGGVNIAENHVGVDRQAWVIAWALVFTAPVAAVAVGWLAAAAAPRPVPDWLEWLHRLWPLGRYPDHRSETP